jgi:glutamyl-tRNA reductase
MSLVVIGLSHRSAPLALLESLSVGNAASALDAAVRAGESIEEALVLATCNRVEVYAEASMFHAAVNDIGQALATHAGLPLPELRRHLYVHYEDRAIAHVFSVACGMESMAIGEGQVLGQMRTALRSFQATSHAGGALADLFQHALRVGKRAHAETGLDRVGRSLVETGLARASELVGPVDAARVLVVGAGAMSSLVATTVARSQPVDLAIVNRSTGSALRLAHATGARALRLDALPQALAEADIVVSCTGAVGSVVPYAAARDAWGERGGRAQVYLDLALPRDVDPQVSSLPGVSVVDLAEVGALLAESDISASGTATDTTAQLQAVRDLVTAEVAAYLTTRRAHTAAPTVAALRSSAAAVVAGELSRLDQRLPNLDEAARAEVQLTVHRVVEKLLHTPSVRVKQLAGTESGGDYAAALRELFDLDPREIAAVSVPPDPNSMT